MRAERSPSSWLPFEDITEPGCARPVTRPAPPLVGLASRSEVVPSSRSAVIGSALPLRRSRRPALGTSELNGAARSHRRRAAPLLGLPSPSEYDRGRLAEALSSDGASLGFLPLQRLRKREPTYPGFASSRFGCGFRVSHPRAAFRLPRPSDPLGPVTLLGFPLRGFSLSTEPQRLSTSIALLPLPARLARPEGRVSRVRTRLQGFAPRESPSRSSGV
jgi:hypothetical protein